jgi:hypothetical protein
VELSLTAKAVRHLPQEDGSEREQDSSRVFLLRLLKARKAPKKIFLAKILDEKAKCLQRRSQNSDEEARIG